MKQNPLRPTNNRCRKSQIKGPLQSKKTQEGLSKENNDKFEALENLEVMEKESKEVEKSQE